LILFWRRQSKRALLIVALYLAAMHGLAARADLSDAAQKSASPLPQFVIDKTLHDFGEVFAGEQLYSIFTVTNVGNAPLELSDKPLLVTRPSVSLYRRPPGLDSLPLLTASAFRPAPV
jgi:hypothetical protein